VGTVAYMSPEQVRVKELDARSDLFSFGSVLYEMATGKLPFRGESSGVVFDGILNRPPAPPLRLNPDLPMALEQIINKCLEKDRNLRYQHASEIRADLQRIKRDNESAQVSAAHARVRTRSLITTKWGLGALLAVLLASVVAAGLYYHSRQKRTLTERDAVLLTTVDNKTGDAVFDDTLRQAIAIELTQSPFLNILSDDKIAGTMQMMGRSAKEPITASVGREICLRTGGKAVLGGSISSLGSHYLIGLTATACSTGDTLAEVQQEANSREEVMKALSQASSNLRGKLGESLPSLAKYDVPIEATTSSLEALKNYSIGIKKDNEEGDLASIPFFKRASELDPDFAMAYGSLAMKYSNLDQQSLALQCASKAYELRDRATERERLHIAAAYFTATGEIDKELQTYQVWIANYPRDDVPHSDLGADYNTLGQYEKALAENLEALRLEPDSVYNYQILAATYRSLGQLDKARETVEQALAQIGDSQRAQALIDELKKGHPAHLLLIFDWLPTAEAVLALHKGNPSQAIADLEVAVPYELGGLAYPAYIRGEAYLQAHNGAAAGVEFRKILDHRSIVTNFVIGALAHLQLGRAYAMAGEPAKAKSAYQDFFALWKDAELDIPVLKEATAEYSRLR
jgi:tetratricopeptide (TPR) repeat protein